MHPQKFRKLGIDLPRQPIVKEGPWLIAGVALAMVFLLLVILAYLIKMK